MRRDRNKEYNRNLLIESALQLFCQRDYQNVSVDLIAQNAGVTKTTFFSHFKSKEEILYEVDINQLTVLNERLNDYPLDGDFLSKLVKAIVAMAVNLHRTPILTQNIIHLGTISTKYRTMLSEVFRNLKETLIKYFELAQSHDLISKRVTAERIAEDFVIIYIGIMSRWSFFESSSSLEMTMEEVYQNYIKGIISK
ncbi:TetR/AcrR family transcriptional regulator [Cohnella endophytica]|uniref:TetR/AcrR family transcriptional regulator n=1 Tax=Cohnella endophytica TaxID=2419778 RepID=A0A494XU61_9BACL|nr:TetR/AcrR family transcriptional regulator [Cohnella endophytica]RKP54110.1 TetR/AcrR family transcriptional regulator [Cohnella endophytica]